MDRQSSFSLDAGRRDGRLRRRGAAPAFADVYVAPVAPTLAAVKLTDMSAQIAGWPTRTLEVVRVEEPGRRGRSKACCTSRPTSTPAQQYPLLVVIHGGPTGISRPTPFAQHRLLSDRSSGSPRGALVLEPNYRGSAGYGEKFRSLNVRNLGVGDAWDVLSGIDH